MSWEDSGPQRQRSAQEVFDAWALDYHADGMEADHRPSVDDAFAMLPEIHGDYLEIGVGNGYAIRKVADDGRIRGALYGLDVSANMIALTEKRLRPHNAQLAQADFLAWQFPRSGSFGLIFSMEVFYYLSDMHAGISKSLSLLQPGGHLVVLVNRYRENTQSHDWDKQLNTPMHLWSEAEYKAAFNQAGFATVRQFRLQAISAVGTLMTWGTKG